MPKILNIIIRTVICIVGQFVLAIGIVAFIKSGIGSDSITILYQGFASFLEVDIGGATVITIITITVIVAILDVKKLGLSTIISIVALGPLIDLVLSFNLIPSSGSMTISIIYMLLGILVCSIGVGLYVSSNLGYSCFEGLVMYFVEKTHKRYGFIKIIVDIVFFIIGYSLGGVIGIGSFMTILLYGPTTDFFIGFFRNRKIIKKLCTNNI